MGLGHQLVRAGRPQRFAGQHVCVAVQADREHAATLGPVDASRPRAISCKKKAYLNAASISAERVDGEGGITFSVFIALLCPPKTGDS